MVYPDMGAKRLTFNYIESQPGDEFPQHVHDYSDDTFLVLQGQVDVRQGDSRRHLGTQPPQTLVAREQADGEPSKR